MATPQDRARAVLTGYAIENGLSLDLDREDVIADVLTDIMLLCDELELDFDLAVQRAEVHHSVERDGTSTG